MKNSNSVFAATTNTFFKMMSFVLVMTVFMTSCQKESMEDMVTTENNQEMMASEEAIVNISMDDINLQSGNSPAAMELMSAVQDTEIDRSSLEGEYDLVGVHDNRIAVGSSETGLQQVIFTISGSYRVSVPVWSNAGDQIAFAVTDLLDETAHILTMNADGSNVRVIGFAQVPGYKSQFSNINWFPGDKTLYSQLSVHNPMGSLGNGATFFVNSNVEQATSEFFQDQAGNINVNDFGDVAYKLEVGGLLSRDKEIIVYDNQTGNREKWLTINHDSYSILLVSDIAFINKNAMYVVLEETQLLGASTSTIYRLDKAANGQVSVRTILNGNPDISLNDLSVSKDEQTLMLQMGGSIVALEMDQDGNVISERLVGHGFDPDMKSIENTEF